MSRATNAAHAIRHDDAAAERARTKFTNRFGFIVDAAAAIVVGALREGKVTTKGDLAFALLKLPALAKATASISERRMGDLLSTAARLGAFESYGFHLVRGYGFCPTVKGSGNVVALSAMRGRREAEQDAGREVEAFRDALARLRRKAGVGG